MDWKDTKDTLKDYPWPYIRFKDWGWDRLESELRVRTAIDRGELRSKESELFAYEQIIPDNKHWYSELDLSKLENKDSSPEDNKKNRMIVLEQLRALCAQGVSGLGKTKTPLKIEFMDPGTSYAQ